MKFSTKGRYAITAMMSLAINDRIRPVTLTEISAKQGISLSYLEQLFSKLRKSGLVKGARGPGGGYRLGKPIGEVTIAEIILAVDANSHTHSKMTDFCSSNHKLWEDFSRQFYDFLDGITLADFISKPETKRIAVVEGSTSSHISKMFQPVSDE